MPESRMNPEALLFTAPVTLLFPASAIVPALLIPLSAVMFPLPMIDAPD